MVSLSPPSEHGRFRALKLWGTPRKGSLDPSLSASYRFGGVNPDILKKELAKVASPLGFALAEPYKFGSDPDLSIATKKLGHHEGTTVTGWFYAERDLKVDKVETHRRDRRRWIGIFGGVIPGAILLYFAFADPYPWGLLAAPGGILFGLALGSALSFANADYWSDIIAVRILAEFPPTVKGTAAREIPANYVAQFWVVRALSQDWESKVGSGRSLMAGVDHPGLDAIRESLLSAISSKPLR